MKKINRAKKNMAIRNALKEHGIPHWMLADKLGISADTFARRIRHELPENEQQRYMELIKEIVEEEE